MTSTAGLFKELESGRVSPVYLLMGEDTGTKEEFVAQLRDRLFGAGGGRSEDGAGSRPSQQAELGTTRYFGDDAGADEVVETLRTSSFFSPVRLVLVHSFDRMRVSGAFDDYLKSPDRDAVLVLLTGKKAVSQKIRKAVEAQGRATIFWPMFRNVGGQWLAREIEKLGMTARREAIDYILDISGMGKDELKNQLAHIGGCLDPGDVLTLEKAREIMSLVYRHTVFDLTGSLFVEGAPKILNVFSRLLENGEDLTKINYFCAREIHKLYACYTLSLRGLAFPEISAHMGLRKMEAARVRSALRVLSMERFERIFSDLARLELLIKTHPRQVAETAYQDFLARAGGTAHGGTLRGAPARGRSERGGGRPGG